MSAPSVGGHEAAGPYEVISRYDAEHGTALVTTLRAYVQADYNAKETARRLYVHPTRSPTACGPSAACSAAIPPAVTCA
jgi:hypothetical protein